MPANLYEPYLNTASRLVRDPADKWFVALALFLRSKHDRVVLLTYNKGDYLYNELARMGVEILTPRELQEAEI